MGGTLEEYSGHDVNGGETSIILNNGSISIATSLVNRLPPCLSDVWVNCKHFFFFLNCRKNAADTYLCSHV